MVKVVLFKIQLVKSQLDYSTFTANLARSEIEYAKRKIKELYILPNTFSDLSHLPSSIEILHIDMETSFYGQIHDLPYSLHTIGFVQINDECNIYEIIDELYKIKFKNIKCIILQCYLDNFICKNKNLIEHLQEVLHNCNREDIEIDYF